MGKGIQAMRGVLVHALGVIAMCAFAAASLVCVLFDSWDELGCATLGCDATSVPVWSGASRYSSATCECEPIHADKF